MAEQISDTAIDYLRCPGDPSWPDHRPGGL